MTQARDGSLWCATSNGLYQCSEISDGTLITNYYNINQPHAPVPKVSNPYNFCHSLIEDPQTDNVFWVATSHGLKKLDAAKNQLITLPSAPNGITNNIVYTLFAPKSSNGNYIWLGTDLGLYRCQVVTGTFEHFVEEPKNEQSLRNNTIFTLLEDRSGLLWIGTNKGVNKLNLRKKAFERIQIFGENNVTCIAKGYNTLWVGSFGQGISSVHFDNGQPTIRHFSLGNPGDFIYNLHVDTEGWLWATTRGGGIFKINQNTPQNFTQYTENSGLSEDYIMTVFEDSQHILWFGTWDHGLIRYDRRLNRFTNISTLPNSPIKLNEYPIIQFYELKNAQNERIMWAGRINARR